VESGEQRTYANGGGGRFISLLLLNDQLLNAWLPIEVESEYRGDLSVQNVTEFDDSKAKSFGIALREWEGKTKRKIVSIGD